VLRKSRSPGDAVATARIRRDAALRAVRRRGLYLMDLRLAILHLRRAGAALRTALPARTPTDLANVEYLGRALELETALLVSIRDSRVIRAETVYHDLVAHHRTQGATAAAIATLPANVRSAAAGHPEDGAEPVAFGLPVSVLADYLQPALPELRPCPHGRLTATGECLAQPCPAGA
jgi:hypothetical protein